MVPAAVLEGMTVQSPKSPSVPVRIRYSIAAESCTAVRSQARNALLCVGLAVKPVGGLTEVTASPLRIALTDIRMAPDTFFQARVPDLRW